MFTPRLQDVTLAVSLVCTKSCIQVRTKSLRFLRSQHTCCCLGAVTTLAVTFDVTPLAS